MLDSEKRKQQGLAEAVRKHDAFKLDPGLVKDPTKLQEKKLPRTIKADTGEDDALNTHG